MTVGPTPGDSGGTSPGGAAEVEEEVVSGKGVRGSLFICTREGGVACWLYVSQVCVCTLRLIYCVSVCVLNIIIIFGILLFVKELFCLSLCVISNSIK